MTTNSATTTRKIFTTVVIGASRRRMGAVTGRGVDALAGVSRGLFGGPARQQARTPSQNLDETAEIIISRAGGPPLASAA